MERHEAQELINEIVKRLLDGAEDCVQETFNDGTVVFDPFEAVITQIADVAEGIVAWRTAARKRTLARAKAAQSTGNINYVRNGLAEAQITGSNIAQMQCVAVDVEKIVTSAGVDYVPRSKRVALANENAKENEKLKERLAQELKAVNMQL